MKLYYIILFTILTFPISAFSQTELSSYNMLSQEISVSYILEGDDKYDFYLDLDEAGTHSINFEINEVDEVNDFFTETYAKFKEWAVIAVENDIKDLNREIDTMKMGQNLAFLYGGWKFSFGSIEVETLMRVTEEGKPMYGIIIPQKVSSSNRYIESDTQVLLWDSEEDFNSFLNHFDEDFIRETVDNHTAQEDLFEN